MLEGMNWELLISSGGAIGGWVVAWNIWKAYQAQLTKSDEREREHREFLSGLINRGGN